MALRAVRGERKFLPDPYLGVVVATFVADRDDFGPILNNSLGGDLPGDVSGITTARGCQKRTAETRSADGE